MSVRAGAGRSQKRALRTAAGQSAGTTRWGQVMQLARWPQQCRVGGAMPDRPALSRHSRAAAWALGARRLWRPGTGRASASQRAKSPMTGATGSTGLGHRGRETSKGAHARPGCGGVMTVRDLECLGSGSVHPLPLARKAFGVIVSRVISLVLVTIRMRAGYPQVVIRKAHGGERG